MKMKPVATIFDPKKVINKNSEINNVTSLICISRRTARECLYQEDQYYLFISKDSAKCLHVSMKVFLVILLERMVSESFFTS